MLYKVRTFTTYRALSVYAPRRDTSSCGYTSLHTKVPSNATTIDVPCAKNLLALYRCAVCYRFILSMVAPAPQGSCRQGCSREAQGCHQGAEESAAGPTWWESSSQARPWRNRTKRAGRRSADRSPRKMRGESAPQYQPPRLSERPHHPSSAHRRFPPYGPA